MRVFRDERGRDWTLSLTVDAIKRIRAETGVDIMRIDSVDENGVPLVQRLTCDVVTIADVAYSLVHPQADNLGVSDVQFAEGLGGDAMRILSQALLEELRDFFQKLGRTEAAALIDRAKQFMAALIAHATAKYETMQIPATTGEPSSNSQELQAFPRAV